MSTNTLAIMIRKGIRKEREGERGMDSGQGEGEKKSDGRGTEKKGQ